MLPRPYSTATCREGFLNSEYNHTFLTTERHERLGEWSAHRQNLKQITFSHNHIKNGENERLLWRSNGVWPENRDISSRTLLLKYKSVRTKYGLLATLTIRNLRNIKICELNSSLLKYINKSYQNFYITIHFEIKQS